MYFTRRGEIVNDQFIANFLLSVRVKRLKSFCK